MNSETLSDLIYLADSSRSWLGTWSGLFPGCAAPDSSVDSHLLIVVRRGRGWKFLLGFRITTTVSRSLYRLYYYSSSLICQRNIWILCRAALVVVDYPIIFSGRLPCREFGFLVKLLLYLAEEINSQSYMYWFVASIFILSAAAREQVPTCFCVWNEALFYCQILFDTLKITERNTSNSASVFGLIVCFWKINT